MIRHQLLYTLLILGKENIISLNENSLILSFAGYVTRKIMTF
jgi:hypothetical protein